jgi:hypothetical protein
MDKETLAGKSPALHSFAINQSVQLGDYVTAATGFSGASATLFQARRGSMKVIQD